MTPYQLLFRGLLLLGLVLWLALLWRNHMLAELLRARQGTTQGQLEAPASLALVPRGESQPMTEGPLAPPPAPALTPMQRLDAFFGCRRDCAVPEVSYADLLRWLNSRGRKQRQLEKLAFPPATPLQQQALLLLLQQHEEARYLPPLLEQLQQTQDHEHFKRLVRALGYYGLESERRQIDEQLLRQFLDSPDQRACALGEALGQVIASHNRALYLEALSQRRSLPCAPRLEAEWQ